MAWDDDKGTAADPDNPTADEQLTADEWDAHVADQKGHASRHEKGGTDEITNLGDVDFDSWNNTLIANGDGATDIIADVNALLSAGGVGTVVKIEPGAYTGVSTKLQTSAAEQEIIAVGASITWGAGFDDTAMVPGGYANCRIYGGVWDHNGANQTGGNLLSTASPGARFVGMVAKNGAGHNFAATGGRDIKFMYCRSTGSGAAQSTQGASTGDGFYVKDADDVAVIGCHVESPWRAGVVGERDTSGTEAKGLTVMGTTFYDCPLGIDHASAGAAAQYRGVAFIECGTTGRNYTASDVADIQFESNAGILDGFVSVDTGRRSVRITDGANGTIVKNGVVVGFNQANVTCGAVERAISGSPDQVFTVKDLHVYEANPASAVLWGGADDGVRIDGIQSDSVTNGVEFTAAATGRVKNCVFYSPDQGVILPTGHGIRLRDNWVSGASVSSYNLSDMAAGGGNRPGITGDVRTINSPQPNMQAYHDGSGTNTEGPAAYVAGSWVSLVDGSTVA